MLLILIKVARFLVKGFVMTLKGGDKIPSSIQYLKGGLDLLESKLEASKLAEVNDLDLLKKVLMVNATYLIKNVCMKIQQLQLEGKSD